jgi:hypothetical protein
MIETIILTIIAWELFKWIINKLWYKIMNK